MFKEVPFRVSSTPIKAFDGWELTEAPHGTIWFFTTACFDVCVWKAKHTEEVDGKETHYPEAWRMSCHRQFGFSKFLKHATDQRTAKLLALKEVQDRCREGFHRAAKAIVDTADAHHQAEKKLPPFREMPLGRPSNTPCEQCHSVPTVPLTKLCGPCTFGDPSTAGGNW